MPHAHLSVHPRVLTFAARLTPEVTQLLEQLDRMGVKQTIITGRTLGSAHGASIGERGTIRRIGLPLRERVALLNLAAAGRLPTLARTADLMHIYAEDDAGLALATAAAGVWGIPVVVSAVPRENGAESRRRLPQTVRQTMRRSALARADAVLVGTREEAEWAAEAGAAPQRLHVLPPTLEQDQRASAVLEIYRSVWARYLAQQVAIWHPTPG